MSDFLVEISVWGEDTVLLSLSRGTGGYEYFRLWPVSPENSCCLLKFAFRFGGNINEEKHRGFCFEAYSVDVAPPQELSAWGTAES